MKRYLLAIANMLCVLAACSVQPATDDKSGAEECFEAAINEISAAVLPFNFGEGARSTLSPTGTFSWESNDKIAFIPQSDECPFGIEQSMFYVNASSAGTASASFTAAGWGLLVNKRYYSYYPYDETATATSVEVKYAGQRQTAPNSSAHLGKYDYLHSYTTVPVVKDGDQVLTYKHLGGIAQFVIDIKDIPGWSSKYFTKFTLTSSSPIFASAATYNPSVESAAIEAAGKTPTNEISVDLGADANGFQSSESTFNIYAMLCPTQWQGVNITASLIDSAENSYEGTFTPTADLEAGKGRGFKIAMAEIETVINLSKYETANCYIVSAYNQDGYRFKPTEGNSNTPVSPASVAVLWETENSTTAPAIGSIINNVRYDKGYIYFNTPATFKLGNALIAAKDANGVILWSWHIWCTDTPKDHQYDNNAGKLMDRNLGAIATSDYGAAGLFYQYGRKDPFPGPSSISKQPKPTIDNSCNPLGEPGGTMVMTPNQFPFTRDGVGKAFLNNRGECPNFASIHQNPCYFFTDFKGFQDRDGNPNEKLTWYYGGGNVKTKHDPCPPGYRTCDGTNDPTKNFWGKSFGGGSKNLTYNQGLRYTLQSGVTAYYPSTGTLTGGGMYSHSALGVLVYSNTPEMLNSGTDGATIIDNGSGLSARCDAGNVRCQKME